MKNRAPEVDLGCGSREVPSPARWRCSPAVSSPLPPPRLPAGESHRGRLGWAWQRLRKSYSKAAVRHGKAGRREGTAEEKTEMFREKKVAEEKTEIFRAKKGAKGFWVTEGFLSTQT